MQDETEKQQRRRVRIIITMIVVLVLLPICMGLLLNGMQYLKFQRRVEAYRKQGYPVTPREALEWKRLPLEDNAIDELSDLDTMYEDMRREWEVWRTVRKSLTPQAIAEAKRDSEEEKEFQKWLKADAEGKEFTPLDLPQENVVVSEESEVKPQPEKGYYPEEIDLDSLGGILQPSSGSHSTKILVDENFIKTVIQKYHKDFAKALEIMKPFSEKIERILKYKGIQTLQEIRFSTPAADFFNLRYLYLLLRLKAYYALYHENNTDEFVLGFQKICAMSKMLYESRLIIARFFAFSFEENAQKMVQFSFFDNRLTSTQYRTLSRTFNELYEQDARVHDVFVIEREMGIAAFRESSENVEQWVEMLYGSNWKMQYYMKFVYFNFFHYLDANAYLDRIDDEEAFSTKAWDKSFLPPPSPAASGTHLCCHREFSLVYVFRHSSSYPVIQSMTRYYEAKAGNGICAIACDIMAGIKQGKPIPADLSAYPQRDPFTGKPFKIARKGKYWYIYSLGQDMKDSGDWWRADIGQIKAVTTGSGDEIFIRIPIK